MPGKSKNGWYVVSITEDLDVWGLKGIDGVAMMTSHSSSVQG